VYAAVIPLADVDEALVEGWRQLGQRALEPNVFADVDFVLPASRRLDSRRRAAIVVVRRNTEVEFVLPVTRLRRFRHIPVPALATWIHPYCYLGTPLVSSSCTEEVWEEALRAMRPHAPWAVLEQLAADGPIAASLATAQSVRSAPFTGLSLPDRPVLRSRPGGDFLNLLSGSRRSKLRRLRPRLEADTGSEVRVVDHTVPGSALNHVIDDFLAMELRGWKGDDGGALSHDLDHAEFFREVCQGFARSGSLQLRALLAGGTTIAYQCNLVAGDTLFGFKTTFDESFRRWSPGVILLLDTIATFQADDRLALYDSCLGSRSTPFGDLFVDRRGLVDGLASLGGVRGRAATRLTPRVATAYRHAKRLRETVPDKARAFQRSFRKTVDERPV
jgi:CelD/BcsL family acetyltransferase involved in cellulose biosynthesis